MLHGAILPAQLLIALRHGRAPNCPSLDQQVRQFKSPGGLPAGCPPNVPLLRRRSSLTFPLKSASHSNVSSAAMSPRCHSFTTLVYASLSFLTLFRPFVAVSATLVNVTVDDSQTDLIQYTPAGLWKAQSDCPTCEANPNPAEAYSGTWHDCSYLQGGGSSDLNFATFSFEGTSLFLLPCKTPL